MAFYTDANGQSASDNIQKISIEDDQNYSGYDLIATEGVQLFALGEHWHNIRKVPRATMKLLEYLHKEANVRILAIEQGKSVAMMINQYLQDGDTLMLEHITRNTMFWGKENRDFFKDLREFNQGLNPGDEIVVQSIDIEYKMESAIFMINQFIGSQEVPTPLSSTVGEFQRVYMETKEHREQFDGLAVMFYYDRAFIQNLIIATINDLEKNSDLYIEFFGNQFTDFATMVLEMDDGLTFDYTNPNNNYKFRDRIIYKNFLSLIDENPGAGILCPIGMQHTLKGSSIQKLKEDASSPIKDQVSIIRISALYNKMINAPDLRKVNFNYPQQLKVNQATLIKHDPEDPALKNKKGFDYTFFINSNGSLTPFENILTE